MRLVWVFACLLPLTLAGRACVWVVGQVLCEKDESKANNVEVRVIDRDSIYPFKFIDPDDLMGVAFTNEEGRFQVDGCADDFDWVPGVVNKPEPFILIRHYCNSERGEVIELPEFHVYIPKTHDVGLIVLDRQNITTTTPRPPINTKTNRLASLPAPAEK